MPNPTPQRFRSCQRSTAFFAGAWLFLLTALASPGATEGEVTTTPPPSRWPVEVMSGVLWKVGGGATPLSYTLTPQIISVLCPSIRQWPVAGGTVVYSTRLSLLLEPIIAGPETYFVGTAAAGYLDWRDPSGKFVVFFAGGGGFGWMDSKGYEVKGAQGQDFNLNWLLNLGLRVRTRHRWQWTASAYFQHISNRGMDKVNPGLNALGPMLGLSRKF